METYEGGRAAPQTPEEELRRLVSSCLLFEDTFYETGGEIAERIVELCEKVPPSYIAELAITSRSQLKLRHVPLFLARQLARLHRGKIVGDTIAAVIQRADELAEFLAIYWKDGRQPLSKQVKRGLALAFTKFDAYQLQKYNRDKAITLRDVMFLVHPKPKDQLQAEVWKAFVDGTLPPPDTWEVALSTGQDKKETWERLIKEGKLGQLATIRNLRAMTEAGVPHHIISSYLAQMRWETTRILPFQFVAAYRNAPQFARELEVAMAASMAPMAGMDLPGYTWVVVDVSGSMEHPLSKRSSLSRMDAAAALAILVRGILGPVRVFTFSNALVEVPNITGFGLLEEIIRSQPHSGTYLGEALRQLSEYPDKPHRVIVITDEQAHDDLPPAFAEHSYIINVAPYEPALDTRQGWVRINGLSERVVEWMIWHELEG